MNNNLTPGFPLTLPLIVKRKAWWLSACTTAMILCLIAMGISAFWYDGRHILLICALTFVLAIIDWKARAYEPTGQLLLAPDSVTVRQAAGTQVYPLTAEVQLAVFLAEVKGEPVGPRTFTTKQGMNNRIYLTVEGQRREFMFLLEPRDVNGLRELVMLWRGYFPGMKVNNFTRQRF